MWREILQRLILLIELHQRLFHPQSILIIRISKTSSSTDVASSIQTPAAEHNNDLDVTPHTEPKVSKSLHELEALIRKKEEELEAQEMVVQMLTPK